MLPEIPSDNIEIYFDRNAGDPWMPLFDRLTQRVRYTTLQGERIIDWLYAMNGSVVD